MEKFLEVLTLMVVFGLVASKIANSPDNSLDSSEEEREEKEEVETIVPCTCGIFLSSQFKKGSPDPPEGAPALLQEINKVFSCNTIGIRQCQSKCLEAIVPYLPTSHKILCASLDRDVKKERAYLFLQNCNSTWFNTNMAAGKEYCCKDGQSYNCPK